jgi:hypothetical protein
LALLISLVATAGCHRAEDSFAGRQEQAVTSVCTYTPDGGTLAPATLDKLRVAGSCATDPDCNGLGAGVRCASPDGNGMRCVAVCTVDGDCPGGSYCDSASGTCTFDCDGAATGAFVCASGQSCGTTGHCGPACTPVLTQPTLSVSPVGLALVVPSGGDLTRSTGSVTVSLTLPDQAAVATASAQTITVTADTGTLVSCDPNADTTHSTFTPSCTLGSWTYRALNDGSGAYAATNRMWIQLAPASGQLNDPSFAVTLSGVNVVHPRVQVAVKPLRPSVVGAPVADGTYQGLLLLKADPSTADAQPGDAPLQVTAYAKDGHLVIVDPTHSVMPSGVVHLQSSGKPGASAYADDWFNDASTKVAGLSGVFKVVVTPTTIAQAGQGGPVAASFIIGLPSPQSGSLTYQVRLKPQGELDVCPAQGSCAIGTTCNATSKRCEPLPAPSYTGSLAISNQLSHDAATRWSRAAANLFNIYNWSDGGASFPPAPPLAASTAGGEPIVNDAYNPAHGAAGHPLQIGATFSETSLVPWGLGTWQMVATEVGYNVCVRDIAELFTNGKGWPSWTILPRSSAYQYGSAASCNPAASGVTSPQQWQTDGYYGAHAANICDHLYGTVAEFNDGGAPDHCGVNRYANYNWRHNLIPCLVDTSVGPYNGGAQADSGQCQTLLSKARQDGLIADLTLPQYLAKYCVETDEVVTWGQTWQSGLRWDNIMLCPYAHMFGPTSGSALAERLACYAPLDRVGNQSCATAACAAGLTCNAQHICVETDPAAALETSRLGTTMLATSGDLRCASDPREPWYAPMPLTFEIFNQRDAAIESSNGAPVHTMSLADMHDKCLADLQLTPSQADAGSATSLSSLLGLFQRRACVSLARFYPAMMHPGVDPGRYSLRLMQQWLAVHSLVAQEGLRKWAIHRVINDGDTSSSGVAPAPADTVEPLTPLVDLLDNAMGLFLDRNVVGALEGVSAAELADPDYRKEHVASFVDPRPIDHEQSDGLPVALLDGMGSYFQLLQFYGRRASATSYDDCKSKSSGTRAAAMARIGNALRVAQTVEALALELHDRALVANANPPWAARWRAVRAAFVAERAQLYAQLRELAACDTFLGINDGATPLYFANPANATTVNDFPASDNLLHNWAERWVDNARNSLANARSAWKDANASEIQQAIQDIGVDQHLTVVEQKYGAQLLQLCGTPPGATESNMLDQFGSNPGQLAPESCFVLPNCNPDAPTPKADCLRGQLGETTLALLGAKQDILIAQSNWQDAQSRLQVKAGHCQWLMQTLGAANDAIAAHAQSMDQMQESLRAAEQVAGTFSMVVGLVTAAAATAATGGAGVVVGAALIAGIANSEGTNIKDDMAEADRDFNASMQELANNVTVQNCFAEESQLRIGIGALAQTVERRAIDFQAALVRFKNQQDQVRQLVAEGQLAVASEKNRSTLQIAHNFWFDEQLDQYLSDFEYAQRMTYLAAQAVEYEFQQSLGVRGQILAATHPNQLRDVLTRQLEATYASQQVDGLPVAKDSIVLGLLDPSGGSLGLLQLSDTTSGRGYSPRQRLRDLITSPANAVYDARGAYVGQGIAFTINENTLGLNAFSLSDKCDERIQQVTGTIAFDVNGLNNGPIPVQLRKRNTFGGRMCSSMQDSSSSVIPWVDPFRGKTGEPRRAVDSFTPVDLQLRWDVTLTELYAPTYPGPFASEQQDMGLYGDYLLVFPWNGLLSNGFQLSHLDNVYFRFDFLRSISSGQARLAHR